MDGGAKTELSRRIALCGGPRRGPNKSDNRMKNLVSVVLGGGRGTRLRPLTRFRSKPAVPLAGKYRLIDIPLSNCLNSQINQIYVLTQFLSVSLHTHIRGAYNFDNFSGGFVSLLAAQQTVDEGTDWYEGTADAVRKNLRYINRPGVEHVLILSGDQLYRMDFREMLATHRASGADVTIATKPVLAEEASQLGIMRVDEQGRVIGFLEKPQTAVELNDMRMSPDWVTAQGIAPGGREFLASMGIYLFNRQALTAVLEHTDYQDFGREVFPASIRSRHVQVHVFDGYWEDIGTIGSFYEANLQLAQAAPPFELVSEEASIFTRPRFLPPTRIDGAEIERSLIADGCIIEPGARVINSVVGLRCRIGRDVTIRDSVIMGSDYYESERITTEDNSGDLPPIGIGAGSHIERAIVDKNCRIAPATRVVLPSDWAGEDRVDRPGIAVRDGVLVVEKDAVVTADWHLSRSE